MSGKHYHQQCDEEINLHPPQRKAGDRSELTALCRFPPVVDEYAQKREVDDTGSDQDIPQHPIEGPAEQGREKFQIAVERHATGPLVARKNRPKRS